MQKQQETLDKQQQQVTDFLPTLQQQIKYLTLEEKDESEFPPKENVETNDSATFTDYSKSSHT